MISTHEIHVFLGEPERQESVRRSVISAAIKEHKVAAVAARNEGLAKELWCLEQTLEIQAKFLRAFDNLQHGNFYGAWSELEQVEITFRFLDPHLKDPPAGFRLDFFREKTKQLQGLFPYRFFFSPEIIEHEKKCNICGAIVSIRNGCGHRVGEVYGGELCIRIVTKMSVVGMAIVTAPVQKYSVLFVVDPETGSSDHHNYSLLQYVMRRIRSPFDAWTYTWTKRLHSHSLFSGLGQGDSCPCKSGQTYGDCCAKAPGVMLNHCEFTFDFVLPDDLLKIEFA